MCVFIKVCVYVYVFMFIKLYITVQSDPVILVMSSYATHIDAPKRGSIIPVTKLSDHRRLRLCV